MLSFEVAAMPVWFPAAAICAAQPPTVATADLQKATATVDHHAGGTNPGWCALPFSEKN